MPNSPCWILYTFFVVFMPKRTHFVSKLHAVLSAYTQFKTFIRSFVLLLHLFHIRAQILFGWFFSSLFDKTIRIFCIRFTLILSFRYSSIFFFCFVLCVLRAKSFKRNIHCLNIQVNYLKWKPKIICKERIRWYVCSFALGHFSEKEKNQIL